jgi:hypothetical protein
MMGYGDMLGIHRLIDILNGDSLILDTHWNLLTYLMGLTLWESNVAMGNARSKIIELPEGRKVGG